MYLSSGLCTLLRAVHLFSGLWPSAWPTLKWVQPVLWEEAAQGQAAGCPACRGDGDHFLPEAPLSLIALKKIHGGNVLQAQRGSRSFGFLRTKTLNGAQGFYGSEHNASPELQSGACARGRGRRGTNT